VRPRDDRYLHRQAHAALRRAQRRARRLVDPRPIACGVLVPGVVVWARVPYADGGGKLRPALVTARRGRDVLVRPITAQQRRLVQPRFYAPLRHWEDAGLERRSSVELRDVPIKVVDVADMIGQLHPDDRPTAFAPPAAWYARPALARFDPERCPA
jgi:hypothetical protein